MFFPVDKTLDLHYAIRDDIVNAKDWTRYLPNKNEKRKKESTLNFMFLSLIFFQVGNIVVRESTDWDEYPQQVVVYRTWRASSPQLSDAMKDFVTLDEANFKVIAGMQLVFDSAEEKNKALKNNCVRVDVEIVYPISLPGTGRLKVETTNGDIHVKFDKILKDQPPTFDTLILATKLGEIQLENVLVISNTTLTSASGHIHGSLRTAGAVEARMLNGPIDLAINTNIIPGQKDWNPRKLDVKLDTLNGPVTLEVVSGSRFYSLKCFKLAPTDFYFFSRSLLSLIVAPVVPRPL